MIQLTDPEPRFHSGFTSHPASNTRACKVANGPVASKNKSLMWEGVAMRVKRNLASPGSYQLEENTYVCRCHVMACFFEGLEATGVCVCVRVRA